MSKGQTIGQLGSNLRAILATQIAIGLLEKSLGPQAANTQESFVVSIFPIDLRSMPMMDTTASQMRNPPQCQIHDK